MVVVGASVKPVQKNGKQLMLTSSGAINSANALWFQTQINVASGFQTRFSFRVEDPQGQGAEGFAFVLQNDNASPFGGAGGDLGYSGILNSLAIEFDMHQDVANSDPNNNHVSFHTRGGVGNNPLEQAPVSIDSSACTGGSGSMYWLTTTNLENFADGKTHHVTINYFGDMKVLHVTVDNAVSPQLQCTLDLEYTLDLMLGNMSWVGFTGSTGPGSATILLEDWWMEDVNPAGGEPTTCFPGFTASQCQPPSAPLIGGSCHGADDSCEACLSYSRACCGWCESTLLCEPTSTNIQPGGGAGTDATCPSPGPQLTCAAGGGPSGLTGGQVALLVICLVSVRARARRPHACAQSRRVRHAADSPSC